MGSIYKVGDKVLVKNKLDDNCVENDYPCGFFGVMINQYGGKICTISCVHRLNKNIYKHKKCYEEPYYYSLEWCGYNWSSAMFEKEF